MKLPLLAVALLLLGSPVAAQVTRRASVGGGGAQGNGESRRAAISADGRHVAFHSNASTLVPVDTNPNYDVFVRDLVAGTTEIVSVDSTGVQGSGEHSYASIWAEGRYVAFQSNANNLIANDLYPGLDVYVHDRVTGTTEKVNLTSGGGQTVLGDSWRPAISADGRYVAFHSPAGDLVPGDTNGTDDLFVRDRVAGTTERVSVSTAGVEGNAWSAYAVISADGRFVAFHSLAGTLVANDTNNRTDAFVHDRVTHVTELVSVSTGGAPGIGDSTMGAISADGRFVAFSSSAPNLVANDTNQTVDAFVRDRVLGTTERVSLNTGGAQGAGHTYANSLSADGRLVGMWSHAFNLVTGDSNQVTDVFVRDRQTGMTERQSLDSEGAQATGASYDPVMSAGGRWIAFSSGAGNLVPGDTNGYTDVFVRDRESASFAILCGPGVSPVMVCPCSNPAVGPSRGCNNSAGTGGAKLVASGVTHLSADSLVFTTSGEKPTALSIVLQGTAYVQSGLVYGQGIRCVGGSLKRLYAKNAVGGSITAPDFGAGDPSVSAQSAAKGDPIQPGQPRWYLVYYRDNVVLGGCPPTSNFNATQTGQVSWAP